MVRTLVRYCPAQGLAMDDLEDLQADIEVYLRIGEDPDYWRDLGTICEAEIEQKNHGVQRRGAPLGTELKSLCDRDVAVVRCSGFLSVGRE
jgi:hypothetical protein